MRTVSIVGAGPAGLLVGVGLADAGYQVTVYSERTAEAMRTSVVPSSAGLSPDAQAAEAELSLNFWDDRVEPLAGVHLDLVAPDRTIVTTVEGPWGDTGPWRCVDLRLKCSVWLTEFERRGGRVVVEDVTPERLEAIAAESELTVVATGKGQLSGLFERDAERCMFDAPQRNISMIIVRDHPGWADKVGFSPLHYSKLLEVGEIFGGTFLNTDERPGVFLIFEGVPGGPVDRFGDVTSAEQQLEVSKQIIRELLPWEWERCKDMELADPMAAIRGRITPTVRKPVARLASGAIVTGVGDTLATKDPVGGQGANSAVKGGRHLLRAILDHGDRPFDGAWMQATWDAFWTTYEQYADAFNNGLMLPPPEFQQRIFLTAGERPELARKLFRCFSHPPSAFPWMVDKAAAEEVLAT